nr:FUN14 domain-containing protein 1-like [Procambarus clarkii]XP_045620214.1 FUN14 domain-containing protein 1-like [Procambarus clarkii]XP_045620215.1 FUN14 domain-containing protein 1-like [Procambarus clarkii]
MGGSSQAKFKKPNEEEEFEVLDVRGTARNGMSWLQQFMQDLTRQPVAKQVAVGGLSGWVVGYVSMKVGKVAATVVGGSLLIMQLAAHKGYIKVDWNRVNRELEKNAKKLKQEVESTVNGGAADENLLQDAARKIDRKLEKAAEKLDRKLNRVEQKAESLISKQIRSARKMYNKHVLGEDRMFTVDELYMLNMYILAFSAGTMLGVGMAKIL